MKIINRVNKHHVYAKWLKSELYRVRTNLTSEDIALIENPRLQNENDNRKREEILLYKYGRIAILQYLPGNIIWHEVKIERNDIDKIYICPVFDWFMDTEQTFLLKKTKQYLAPNRGHRLPNVPQMTTTHYQKIEDMSALPQNYEDIVMISTHTINKPFTIIDGTHRATFLYRNNNLVGTKGYLGIAEDLSQCQWSIERTNIQIAIQELNDYVDAGMIW